MLAKLSCRYQVRLGTRLKWRHQSLCLSKRSTVTQSLISHPSFLFASSCNAFFLYFQQLFIKSNMRIQLNVVLNILIRAKLSLLIKECDDFESVLLFMLRYICQFYPQLPLPTFPLSAYCLAPLLQRIVHLFQPCMKETQIKCCLIPTDSRCPYQSNII